MVPETRVETVEVHREVPIHTERIVEVEVVKEIVVPETRVETVEVHREVPVHTERVVEVPVT